MTIKCTTCRQLRKRASHRLQSGVVSQVVCHEFVSDHLAVLGTSDGTIYLMDIVQHRLECQTKCLFIPSKIRLHPDKAIFVAVSSEKALVQCFDIALNPLKLTLVHEAEIGTHGQVGTVMDLSQYFESSPVSLVDAIWCQRRKSGSDGVDLNPCPMEAMATNNLCLRFGSGPLVNVQVSGGVMSGAPGAIGPVEITSSYLSHNQHNQVSCRPRSCPNVFFPANTPSETIH